MSDYPTIEFTEERLDNGLRVIIAEDHLAPVAAVNLWYGVGSKHEQPGRTGIAHLFEHMMFQGSANVAKGEHFRLIEMAGGVCNATTWLHRTNYYAWAPSHTLELLLWLEADRMGGLLDALSQETLDNQRDVVRNERRQTYENRPYGMWLETILPLVFPEGHPYHHPTIGSMADLEAASLEDVRDFFRVHYAPNNAILSIVGDVEPDRTREWVRRYFGPIPSSPTLPPAPEVNLSLGLGEEQRVTVHDRVPLPRIYVAYRAPEAGSPEADALSVGAIVLSGASISGVSKGSRLHRRLVHETELAQSVEFGLWEFEGVSMAVGWVTARPGVDLAALESAFHETVSSLATEPPRSGEMERARAGLERAFIDQHFVTVASRADWLSENATVFGDPQMANEHLPRLMAVDAGQIQEAAAAVFRPDNRAAVTFLPAGGNGGPAGGNGGPAGGNGDPAGGNGGPAGASGAGGDVR